jgi:hypothetical protein
MILTIYKQRKLTIYKHRERVPFDKSDAKIVRWQWEANNFSLYRVIL